MNTLDRVTNEREYSRLILFELIHSGEVVTINPIAIQVLSNGSAHIINLKSKKKGKLDFKKKTLERIDMAKIYKKLDSASQSQSISFYKLLVVDFQEKDFCNCRFYSDLKAKVLDEIKNLSLFK